jgi:pimeloyl-ACP methyl ester carboxylesterase
MVAQSEHNEICDTTVDGDRLLIVIDTRPPEQASASIRPWLDNLSKFVRLIEFAWHESLAPGHPDHIRSAIDQVDALWSGLEHRSLVLFGVAEGGLVALAYALDYPHRLDGLVLCDMEPLPDVMDIDTAAANDLSVNLDHLALVTTPTLILAGRQDGVRGVAETAERLHAMMTNSALVLFDHSGQYPYREEPDRFRAVVADWLCRRP